MNITTIDDLKRWRRHLHMNPEVSLKEFETARYIRNELSEIGFTDIVECENSTIAFLDSGKENSVLLRADIDALPLEEENDCPFKSKNPGVMHACGHDAHTAMLLGAAKEIMELYKKDLLNVNVIFVFQQSEESIGGANRLIKDYDFSKHNIKAAFALHVNPDYEEGVIATRVGPIMSSTSEFSISIKGKSAHCGIREKGINALNAAVLVYQQFQAIPTYILDPKHTNILHIGSMKVGEAMNIVPTNGFMEGTIRTYDMDDLALMKKRMYEICEGVSICTGCSVKLNFKDSYPPVINDEFLVSKMKAAAENSNAEFVLREDPYLLGEDFAFFGKLMPICFSFIGIRNEELGYVTGLHTPTLSMREEALIFGVDYLVQSLLQVGS